jgi:hypothetical protein
VTVHGICVQARHEPCAVCHAAPEQPCSAGRPGVHLCRVCRAAHDGLITYGDAASVMYGTVFAGWSLVPDVTP